MSWRWHFREAVLNNPAVGDERFFLTGRTAGQSGPVRDSIRVSVGDIVTVRVYIANNGPPTSSTQGLNARIEVPRGLSERARIYAYVGADNSSPKVIYDSVVLFSDRPFAARMVRGSARLDNRSNRHFRIADSIADRGAALGFSKLNGRISGCYCQAGYLTARLAIQAPR